MKNKKFETKFSSFEEMKDQYPPILYKYRRWNNEYDRRTITHGELYFASPRTFEDPKDCKQTVRFEKLTLDEKLNWIEYQLKRDNQNLSSRSVKDRALQIFEKSPIRNNETAKELTDQMLERYFDITGVLSVTGDPENELMWLKYADCHKGFCIGFDSLLAFKNGIAGSGSKVFYEKELPEIKPEPIMSYEEQRIKQIYFKEEKWQFEDEYRLHKIEYPVYPDENRRVYPPPQAFKELIIGKNMSEKDFQDLITQIPDELKHMEIIRL